MRREANFSNTIVEILRKSRREERGEKNDVTDVGERKRNLAMILPKIKK